MKRDAAVDFQKEILPLFRKNCLACHNASTAKGDVVLETPQTIQAGAKGEPIVVAGKGEESKLIKAAAHREKPFMPPAKNKVGAVPLLPEELGLIKLWIDQGAKGTVTAESVVVHWYPLPPGPNPIYAAALSDGGQLAACGRANQVFVYNLSTGKVLTRLTDPSLIEMGLYKQPGAADLDNIQSLAFESQGDLLASGGYRAVKIWRRIHAVERAALALPNAAPPAPPVPPDQTQGVAAVAVRADGKWLAAGTQDGALYLWELVEGQAPAGPRALAEKHDKAVVAVSFLPPGDRLCSASLDGSIRFWNVPAGESAGRINTPGAVQAMALLAGGARLVSGGPDGVLRVWTVPAAGQFVPGQAPVSEPAAFFPAHEKPVTALAAVPGAEAQCISGSEDGMVRQWDVNTKQKLREMAHGAAVTAVAARPDGKRFASAGADQRVKLWEAQDGKQVVETKGGDYRTELPVTRLARKLKVFTGRVDDGKKAVEGAEKENQAKGEAETKATEALAAADKALAEKKTTADEAAKAAVADAGKKTAAEEAAKALKSAEEAQAKAKQAAEESARAHKEAGDAVARQKGVLTAAEAAVKEPQAVLEAATKSAGESGRVVRALVFSPDGTRLAGGGDGGAVQTWSADDGAAFEAWKSHETVVSSVAFLGAGSIVAAGVGGGAATRIWDLEPPWKLEKVIGSVADPSTFADRVTAVIFSPDGRLLATASGEPSRRGELKVWKVEDWSLLWALPDAHSDAIFAAEFTVDGDYLATCGADKFVKVFRAADGKLVKAFEGHTGQVFGVSWSYDGKLLASCDADKVIKVWDFLSGEQRRTIGGFARQVTAIRFVGDTQNTIACSGDKTVRMHQTDNGNQVRNLEGPTDYMYSVAATPDGRFVAAGGFDSILRVWNAADGKLLRAFEPPKPE